MKYHPAADSKGCYDVALSEIRKRGVSEGRFEPQDDEERAIAPLVIDVPGLPVPFARSGGHGKVRFTPAKQRHAMADLKIIASRAMAGRKPLDGPLAVEFIFTWPIPASWSNRRRAAPEARWRTSRPDADNLIKLCADSLNGVVWLDDALIVDARVRKLHGDEASTRVVVRPL